MPGYLLLWDGDPKRWPNANASWRQVVRTGHTEIDWSCGNRKNIPLGSRLFLKRSQTSMRGLVASGYASGHPWKDSNWGGRRGFTYRVPMTFDAIIDPHSDDLLPADALQQGAMRRVHWKAQAGGIEISDDALEDLETVWAEHLAGKGMKVPVPLSHSWQKRSMTWSRRLSRNSLFSRDVRARSDGHCAVCPEKMFYGTVNIIEVAHIRSVAANGPDDHSNALPLCPNHHALFDEGFWTLDIRGNIVLAKKLPASLAATLTTRIKLSWKPATHHLKWHRENVFLG